MSDYAEQSQPDFKGVFKSFGHSVAVINKSRVGALRRNAEPTVFHFRNFINQFVITVGNSDREEFVGINREGYLCISTEVTLFTLVDLDGRPLSKDQSAGEKVVHLVAAGNSPVILYDGADGFDDLDNIYNFLIAGRKLREQSEEKGVFYIVPTGEGTWEDHPADEPYTAKPTPLVLTIL